VPYQAPLIFQRGQGQYLWDETGKKYIDLLSMNLCISVGHAHPEWSERLPSKWRRLTHCTRCLSSRASSISLKKLVATMPAGHDWVVHSPPAVRSERSRFN